MKKSSGIFLVFIILSIISRITLSQSPPSAWPTFSMTVRNITSYPGPNDQDSILTFDVYMLQTNFGQHGIDPFEYCCAQYFWFFNKNIFRNPSIGNLKLTNLGNQTDVPPEIRPASFLVDSSDFFGPDVGILGVAGRSGYSYLNFFINSIFPGTKMLKLKLTTSGHQWNFAPLNLRFKLNNAPYTFVAYFTPYPPGTDTSKSPPQYVQALLDTNINQYIVENYFVLPVELENFVSIVSGNNVELNWTTTAETNNQKFEIERSNSNLIEWTKIGEVQGSGTTSEPRNYNFTDRKLNTGHYKYRL
ncbi:MAG: hypothetical protein KDD00_17695, partial [Ignavibacteriae bacterium]|nr:hypothetical protein [Ignavibacteriota bacterium]